MPVDIFDHRGLAQDDLRDGVIQNIAAYLGQAGTPGQAAGGIAASRVAATAAINTTETLLQSIGLVLAGTTNGAAFLGTLNVGTRIRITITGTCTSTNADVSTFTLRAGILGTTADASVATAAVTSSGSGTTIGFQIVINATVRTLGATGTLAGSMAVTNTGVTGIAGVTNTVVPFTSTTLATTTATFLDITYVSAATTTTCTFQTATIEVIP
jgi:hypothetical protein